MRKFVLIAAMVLASATAQAGQSRSLTTAQADPPVVTQAKPTETTKAADVVTPAAPRGSSDIRGTSRRRRHHHDHNRTASCAAEGG